MPQRVPSFASSTATEVHTPPPCSKSGSRIIHSKEQRLTWRPGGAFTILDFLALKILRTPTLWAGFSSDYSVAFTSAWAVAMKTQITSLLRSEERRVGKEWGTR